jgi:hypothetical protein
MISVRILRYQVQEHAAQSSGRVFSDNREVLAHCWRPLHVRLLGHATLQASPSLTLHWQLGVCHHPRLRVECNSRAPSILVDDMGL